MGRFIQRIFGTTFACCKRHKVLLTFLLLGVCASIILGIVSAIQINGSMFPQDFSNVAYVKFLGGSIGFAGFLFTTLFTLLIFVVVILICSYKPYFLWLGAIFFMYFVYAQIVTIISISMDYGFFNTLILLLFMIIVSILYFFFFTMIFISCADCCNSPNYFYYAFRLIAPLIISLTLVALINVIFLMTLKNFVFVLVY